MRIFISKFSFFSDKICLKMGLGYKIKNNWKKYLGNIFRFYLVARFAITIPVIAHKTNLTNKCAEAYVEYCEYVHYAHQKSKEKYPLLFWGDSSYLVGEEYSKRLNESIKTFHTLFAINGLGLGFFTMEAYEKIKNKKKKHN